MSIALPPKAENLGRRHLSIATQLNRSLPVLRVNTNTKESRMLSARLLVASVLMLPISSAFTAAADAPPAADAPKQPASVTPAEKDRGRHEQFLKDKEELLKKGPIQVVFIGDSITDGWRGGGKKVWDEHFGKYNPLNLGIGGDRTEHVLWRLQHGELDGLEPKAVVVMIGTNNIGSSSNDIIAGIKADLNAIHEKVPSAKILLLGVFPRGKSPADMARDRIKVVNFAIEKLDGHDNIKFLDIGEKFLEPDGTLPPEIMPDALHPNEKGYGIWADAIQPALDEMVK